MGTAASSSLVQGSGRESSRESVRSRGGGRAVGGSGKGNLHPCPSSPPSCPVASSSSPGHGLHSLSPAPHNTQGPDGALLGTRKVGRGEGCLPREASQWPGVDTPGPWARSAPGWLCGCLAPPSGPQFLHLKKKKRDFPGGAVVKSPPANAGDTGSSPGPGRSHMP